MSQMEPDKIKEAWDKYMIMRFTYEEHMEVKLLGADAREINSADNIG